MLQRIVSSGRTTRRMFYPTNPINPMHVLSCFILPTLSILCTFYPTNPITFHFTCGLSYQSYQPRHVSFCIAFLSFALSYQSYQCSRFILPILSCFILHVTLTPRFILPNLSAMSHQPYPISHINHLTSVPIFSSNRAPSIMRPYHSNITYQ